MAGPFIQPVICTMPERRNLAETNARVLGPDTIISEHPELCLTEGYFEACPVAHEFGGREKALPYPMPPLRRPGRNRRAWSRRNP